MKKCPVGDETELIYHETAGVKVNYTGTLYKTVPYKNYPYCKPELEDEKQREYSDKLIKQYEDDNFWNYQAMHSFRFHFIQYWVQGAMPCLFFVILILLPFGEYALDQYFS